MSAIVGEPTILVVDSLVVARQILDGAKAASTTAPQKINLAMAYIALAEAETRRG